MGQRLELQTLLETLLGSGNVYFQPPANVQMLYPCIVYNRDNIDVKFADNSAYTRAKRYLVTVIDRNPDSTIPDLVSALPLCDYRNAFVADNLHHDVFVLYF